MRLLAIFLLLTSTAQAAEPDKTLHATGSAAIAYVASDYYKLSDHPVIYPFALSMGVGLVKELTDARIDHNDLSADAIGALIGTVAGNQKYVLPNWTTTDKRLMQSYIVMGAIDVMQTRHCLTLPNCSEANPLMGSRPSSEKLVGYKLAGAGAIYWIADEVPEYRSGVLWAANAVQFVVVRRNYFELEF